MGECLSLVLLRLLNFSSGERDIIDESPAALSMTVDSYYVDVLKLISVALSPPCYRLSISYLLLQKSMRDINLLSYPLFSPSILAWIPSLDAGYDSKFEVSRLYCSVVLVWIVSTLSSESIRCCLTLSYKFILAMLAVECYFSYWG